MPVSDGENEGFSERLERALRRKGIRKMYALAVELRVDESAISRWRRGRAISTDNLIRLSGYLGASIDWLLTGRGAPSPDEDPTAAWARHLRTTLEASHPGGTAALSNVLKKIADACEELSRIG